MKTEIRCEVVNYGRRVDVLVMRRDHQGELQFAKPIEWAKVEDQDMVQEATVSVRMDAAQQLMDDLWRCGLRPSEGTGSAGSLAATERHLKDMQAISMALLRKDGVQIDGGRS